MIGMTTEGIYRKAGVHSKITTLLTEFLNGGYSHTIRPCSNILSHIRVCNRG